MKKSLLIALNALPILVMIGLIPLIQDDFFLAGAYIAIIVAAFAVRRERNDGIVFVFGLFAMTLSEYLFISTGVETFERDSLFDLMPIWLPLLWGLVTVQYLNAHIQQKGYACLINRPNFG